MSEATLNYEELLEARKSPFLVVQEVPSRYESEEPPPCQSSSSDDDIEEEAGCRGDFVLLRQSAPNNPETAERALRSSLPKTEKQEPMSIDSHPESHIAASPKSKKSPGPSNGMIGTMHYRPVEALHRNRKESMELINRTDVLRLRDDVPSLTRDLSTPSSNGRSISPPSKKPKYNIAPPLSRESTSPLKQEEVPDFKRSPSSNVETVAPSPIFSQYGVEKRDKPGDRTLAAIQRPSPPRSIGSPSSVHTLPSLTTALAANPISTFSLLTPSLTRANSSQFGPSLPAALSMPSIMSPTYGNGLASYITSRGRAESTSAPSEQTSASTPTISWSTSQSPAASLPTPYSIPSPQYQHQQLPPISHLTSYAGDSLPPIAASMLSPASSTTTGEQLSPPTHHQVPLSPTSHTQPQPQQLYTCPQPGCNSAPFATQYLLNSHMNVHSESRPHFCPINGCPRGPGGQGFKRKNEMIRHGLVHTSPGYTCPFCPGSGPQQHRYPRPDNLQRHVRVHHGEVGRDDARLRAVLGQRPADGSEVERMGLQVEHEALMMHGSGGGGGKRRGRRGG